MKKIALVAIAAFAGWLVWAKVQQEQAERALWAEVTDSFGETPETFAS